MLFLDELPEFDRKVLEVLREPLESGRIVISRAARQAEYPARFQLVAAMNPCPCGYLGHPGSRCHCTHEQIARYRGRLSGPLLDRIDMHVEVPSLPQQVLHTAAPAGESSDVVRARVITARQRQLERQATANADLNNRQCAQLCQLDDKSLDLLELAAERLGLSARSYYRILRLARTIADLADSREIEQPHLSEAIGYRRLDRKNT